MKRPLFALIALIICAGCSGPVHDEEQHLRGDVLLRNVTLISPERTAPQTGMDVLINAGRITAIGESLSADASRTIEGDGRFLTPGLIDSHVHLAFAPGMSFEQEQANPEIAAEAHAQIPRSYLFYGFTTLIDLNSTPDRIASWNAQEIRPQAYYCGGAPVIDGYPMRFTPAPARYRIIPYFLLDGGEIPEGVVAEDHTPEAVTARLKEDGAICVKTHYEPGFGGRRIWPTPSVELIETLVREAHERGLPVLLHANSQEAQEFGVAAGVDAFAHGMWTWNDREAIALNGAIENLLDRIIAAKIATQPTFQVLYGERDLHDPDYLALPELKNAAPQNLIDWYATSDGQSYRQEYAELPIIADRLATEGWQAIGAEPIARVTATFEHLIANEAPLLFGSDTPSDLTYANPPGLNGRFEMQRWVDRGVNPERLLRAATLDNAVFFGLEKEIGTIETGKRADLLLLSENPLQSISAYDSIDYVILNGEPINRGELSAREN